MTDRQLAQIITKLNAILWLLAEIAEAIQPDSPPTGSTSAKCCRR